MQSKTWIALGALAVIGLLSFLTLSKPQKGELVGPRERPIAALKAADVKELSLLANAGKDAVTMKSDGKSWTLSAPLSYPADQSLAKTAVDQLEKITFGDLVTEKKEKFADFEVSDDKGAHVTAKDAGGKVLFDAWIGKSVSGFTMVRPVGKDQVWQATGLFKYSYGRPAKDWRDHTVLTFNKDDVKKISVESAGQRITLEKLPAAPPDKEHPAAPAPDARWKVGESTVKVDPVDDNVANQMVLALSSLVANDFADGARVEDSGLGTPHYKVTVSTSTQPMALLLGTLKGDDWYAQVDGKPQVYLMKKYAMERIAQKPVDFRDKTIVKAKEDDLASVEITKGTDKVSLDHGAAGWSWGKGGKGTLDENKVKGVVSAFADFKGSAFAESTNPAETGLGKPAGEVVLHLRDKAVVTIQVGATSKDGTEDYVQKVGSPEVMMVKKYAVDRFLRTAAELEKSATPPSPHGGGMGMPPGMQMPPM